MKRAIDTGPSAGPSRGTSWSGRVPAWVPVVLGLLAFALLIWFVGPLVAVADRVPLDGAWPRALTIAAVAALVGTIQVLRWRRRRRAEAALEDAIAPAGPAGDGEELAERMRKALAVLRRSSGSSTYLYELPWYVIIGPPGAGKTTALLNSGLRFPLAEGSGALGGVGGTRYCDWWFTDEAVLIDTAGRYTTQDSDAAADRESWMAFLTLLKRHRPRQPVNGVIVALGLDELLTGTEASLAAHAAAIRDRLMELHEVFRTDVPVYVLFTKADLIAGFTEFFGAFSAARRQKVWGTTFRPARPRDPTLPLAGPEFDALVRRLSVEVTDRMQDEPDAVSRIAIFGFPAQVAMLRDKVLAVLEGVFGATRYKVNATLRGFYFASGTQEGTPIDQILGAMERSFGISGPSALSGPGRSYFLHDLLRKVIFPEAGWVSQDRRAVQREAALRYAVIGSLALGIAGLGTAWGMALVQGRQLAASAAAAGAAYASEARLELNRVEIDDTDLLEIEPLLQQLRAQYTALQDQTGHLADRLGLGQGEALAAAARRAYREGLERHLRPRLMLHMEERIASDYDRNDLMSLYQSVKVYKLLTHRAPPLDEAFVREAILSWFLVDWARDPRYRGGALGAPENFPSNRLAVYLQDMLTLSVTQTRTRVDPHDALLARVESRLQGLHLEDRAWLLAVGIGDPEGVEPFNLALRAGPHAALVFETRDGRALDELIVPAVFTYAGFHTHFLPRLSQVAQELVDEYWVLGPGYDRSTIEADLLRLRGPIMNRYAREFQDAWQAVLGNLRLRPVLADGPNFDVMNWLQGASESPLGMLVQAVSTETRLTADFFAEGRFGAGFGQTGMALPEGAQPLADATAALLLRRAEERATGISRLGFDVFRQSQTAGQGTGAGTGQGRATADLPGANVEELFSRWHALVVESAGTRNIDQLLGDLRDINRLLLRSTAGPGQIDANLAGELAQKAGELSRWITRIPTPLDGMIGQVVDELRGGAADTALAVLNQRLANEVTRVCERVVPESYPFARRSNRDLPIAEFAALFGPQGALNRFFDEALLEHADISADPWRWRSDSRLGAQMSPDTLAQFQRAAEIRDRFFPGGALTPGFNISLRAGDLSAGTDSAILNVHGQRIIGLPTANQPQSLFWPPPGGDPQVSLQLEPELPGRESQLQMPPGPWALLRLIERGNSGTLRRDGISFRVTIDGRHVAYAIRAEVSENPFDLEAIRSFRCPRGL